MRREWSCRIGGHLQEIQDVVILNEKRKEREKFEVQSASGHSSKVVFAHGGFSVVSRILGTLLKHDSDGNESVKGLVS